MQSLVVIYSVIAVLVVDTSALEGEMAELAKMLRESCLDETGADIALINKVNDGADLMPDPKLKCYIKCVMETTGMMSEGAIDVEAVVAMLPPELQKHADKMRACGTKRGADDCDTAFLTQACWQSNCKEDYILV